MSIEPGAEIIPPRRSLMKITPWLAAIALTAGLTPAVHAQYGQYDQHDRHDRQGYDGSWRYGNPSQSWRSERVAALAHDIDETATYIHEQAERNNRRPDRNEARALAELHQLNEAASHFHEQVEESDRVSYRHTRDDFAELIASYNETVQALRYIETRSYINRGMNRIASDMNEIGRFYGRSYGSLFSTGRWGSRSGRYDRYDRDRDDRRDGYSRDDDRPYDRPPVR
jgi:hypothetical protein